MKEPCRPSAPERRASVRHRHRPATAGCEIESPEKEERWSATIRDVSVTGMGLIVPRRFEPGTELEIDGISSATTSLTMVVARVASLPDGTWLLGCTLENPLTANELRDWAGDS